MWCRWVPVTTCHPLPPPLPKALHVWYHEEETAVLLQSAQESQERHAGYDDAGDQQYVGNAEFGQVRAKCSQLKVQGHVHAKAQHCHTTHLSEGKCVTVRRLSSNNIFKGLCTAEQFNWLLVVLV